MRDDMFQHDLSLSKETRVKNEEIKFNFDKVFLCWWRCIHIPLEGWYQNWRTLPYNTRREKTKNNDKSKTEAMFSPGAGRKEDATIIDKELDIMIGEQEFYSYTKQEIQILAKYLHILSTRWWRYRKKNQSSMQRLYPSWKSTM